MTDLNHLPAPVLVVGFWVYFIALWCLITVIIAYLGGWQRLAKRYRTTRPPSVKAFRMTSCTIGLFCSYKSCLNIYVSAEGLYLSVIFLFRLAHPPLFIPWDDIRVTGEDQFFWVKTVTLAVGNPIIASVTLPKKVLDAREAT